jgi:hypothetical protein
MFLRDFLKLGDDHMELTKERRILLIWSTSGKRPTVLIKKLVETAEERFFGNERDCHIILYSIETAKDEIKQRNGNA